MHKIEWVWRFNLFVCILYMHTLASFQADLMCILFCMCASVSLFHCSFQLYILSRRLCLFLHLFPSLAFCLKTFICFKSFCYTFFVYISVLYVWICLAVCIYCHLVCVNMQICTTMSPCVYWERVQCAPCTQWAHNDRGNEMAAERRGEVGAKRCVCIVNSSIWFVYIV